MKAQAGITLASACSFALTAALLSSAQQVAPPGSVPGMQPAQDDAARRVDDYLTRLVPYGFSGAVLIAKDHHVVLKKGYGLANRASGPPYTPDLVASVGSVTKQFTGAAIVKLETQGKLRTSDPISKYLPGVPADKASITIHHLLTHTAGFAGDFGGRDDDPITRDALVAKVLAAPLVSAPGEQFEYSNEGYALAGAIVERVSGQGYEEYLRQHLFLPAGMTDTGYQLPAWPLERLPIGYGPDGGEFGRVFQRHWLPDGPGWYLRANGGIHSTLDDLYRWHRALEANTVLSADAAKKFQTGYVSSLGGSERYAYGWGVQKTRRGTTVITHNGGNGFFFTDFRRYIDERVVIIAMSNQPVIPATQLAPRQIEPLFFGEDSVVMPPRGVDVPRAQREMLSGIYQFDDGATLTVRVTESALELEASDPTLLSAERIIPPGGKFLALESRTMAIVTEAAKDNFRPLFEAFNDERPCEVVQSNQRKFWAGWRAEFGEFAKAEMLGTTMVQGDPAITVRLHFANGAQVLQYIWGPRRLVGFRVMPAARPVTLVAESPSSWVLYSYRLAQPITVTFQGPSITITRDGIARIARKR